jgi:drug/metabolite transporter (DMT)-like permease
MADASVVMPINFLQLPAMEIVGLLLYAEGLDPFTLAGGGLILAASYLNIRWSRRRAG